MSTAEKVNKKQKYNSSGSNLRSVVVVGAAGNIINNTSVDTNVGVSADTSGEMKVKTKAIKPADYKDPRTPEQIAENEQRRQAHLERMKKFAGRRVGMSVIDGPATSEKTSGSARYSEGKLVIDSKAEVEEILKTNKHKIYDKKKFDPESRVQLICSAESQGCHFARVTRDKKIHYVIQPQQALTTALELANSQVISNDLAKPAVTETSTLTSSDSETKSSTDSTDSADSVDAPIAAKFNFEQHHVDNFNKIFNCACELATLKEDAKMFGKEKELTIFLAEHILRGSTKGVKSMERTIADKIIADLSANPRYLHLQSMAPSSLDFVLKVTGDEDVDIDVEDEDEKTTDAPTEVTEVTDNCNGNESSYDDSTSQGNISAKGKVDTKKAKDYGNGPFVVVDVVKAVFQAYHNYGIIVEDTWEKFLAKYTNSPLLAINKQWRLLVFGKLDRGRRNWHLYQAVATELWQTIAVKLPWVRNYLISVKDDEITFATGGDNQVTCRDIRDSHAARVKTKTLGPQTVANNIVRDLTSLGLPAYAHISSFWKENLPFVKKSAAAKFKPKTEYKIKTKPELPPVLPTSSSIESVDEVKESTDTTAPIVSIYPMNPGFVRHFYSFGGQDKLFDIKGAKGTQLRVEWMSQLAKYAAKKA